MSILRVQATKASCRVSGCACHERVPRYPSDLTDTQWALLRPEAQAVMAELRRSPAGRPMEHDLRAVLDAIGYVTRYGIEWRALPVDFPPWEAVYAFSNGGTPVVCPKDWSTASAGGYGWRAAAPICPPPDRLTPNRSRRRTRLVAPLADTTAGRR
jgi:transposase